MSAPAIHWFRRDLRLEDNPALVAAAQQGPVLPVFIIDPLVEAMGAAPRWRLSQSLAALQADLQAQGSRLILRRGDAAQALLALARETGARQVHWQRDPAPDAQTRDRAVRDALSAQNITVTAHRGALLTEPERIATASGTPYQVFTPFWRALRSHDMLAPCPTPRLELPPNAPESLPLPDLAPDMRRGAAVVARHTHAGASAAHSALAQFVETDLAAYPESRDRLDQRGTSGLSAALAWGEIAPARVWHAGLAARDKGNPGAEAFLRQLAWRDFAAHLMFHRPEMARAPFRPDWADFPWTAPDTAFTAWCRARTGEPVVDAALRELWVTGHMHNRARMIVASYLTKHLLTHWHAGMDWFAETLCDWDPANNTLGWQWVAGCGPDAAPYFRIFNPATQAEKFDPDGTYRRYWLDGAGAAQWYEAIPARWSQSPQDLPPTPLIDLKTGRADALAAYERWKR